MVFIARAAFKVKSLVKIFVSFLKLGGKTPLLFYCNKLILVMPF